MLSGKVFEIVCNKENTKEMDENNHKRALKPNYNITIHKCLKLYEIL